jgi:LysR family transcriptional regulator for bpeEF and oprC
MLDLRALSAFVRVAERRSFAAAARELGVTPSGVSNTIGRLEARLGVQLLARTTRRVALTEDGTAFFERCRTALADLDEAELVLSRARLTPAGRLRVDVPVSFGRLQVVPLLGEFQASYPDLHLALSFNDRFIDLIEDGVDIAVRLGALQDSSLIARRLGGTRFRVFGAPAYFAKYGRPRLPDDLASHNCLGFASRDTRQVRQWRFIQDGESRSVMPTGNLTFSDGAALCDASVSRPPVSSSLCSIRFSPVLNRFLWCTRRRAIFCRRFALSSTS